MHPTSSFEIFIWTALSYISITLSIILPALAAYWAWRAYRKGKKIGYVFLLLLALMTYCFWGMNKISHYIHHEEIERINREMTERMKEQRNSGVVPVFNNNIRFPLSDILLAAGVFCLYRAEKKGSKQQP